MNNTHISIAIHKLVCKTFLNNPENKPFVNHKDLNRSNNKLENLEWITHIDNVNHALDLRDRKKPTNQGKVVLQINMITRAIINEFISISNASKSTKISLGGISLCCNGKQKSSGGFWWKFKKPNDNNEIKNLEWLIQEKKTSVNNIHTSKAVLQIDANTNKVISEYCSIQDASKSTKIARTGISLCCNEKQKTSKGFIWKFKESNNKSQKQNQKPCNRTSKIVLQIDMNTKKVISEFCSPTHASIGTKIERTVISRCCNGRSKNGCGYFWRYKTDNWELETQTSDKIGIVKVK